MSEAIAYVESPVNGSGADWYAENVQTVAVVFLCSVVSFVLVFAILAAYMRLQFAVRTTEQLETMDSPELVLIKSHTRATRMLSLVGMSLQVMLLLRVANISDDDRRSSDAFAFSLFRPVSNLCIYFVGFMTNTHAFFRVGFALLLAQMIVTDTIAQVTVAMVANCLRVEGLRCGEALTSLSLADLEALQLRDHFNLFLNPWLVLEVAYLSQTIGFCSSRYSSRRLSLSRPRYNIRAALAFYFPMQFGLDAAQVRQLRRQRRHDGHQPKQWKA